MNKFISFCIAILGAVALLMVACQPDGPELGNLPEARPALPDPHHHVVDVNNNWLWKQNVTGFTLKGASAIPSGERENIAHSPDQKFFAFSMCDKFCYIFIEEIAHRQVYELHASSFSPGRPFLDLIWITNDILVFDQWSQPHHGVHYAVNVKERKLLLASPFTDQIQ